MNYPIKLIPVAIPAALLIEANQPDSINLGIPESKRVQAAKLRSRAVEQIGAFLANRKAISTFRNGRPSQDQAIEYLDAYYPGWRGYEVTYVSGRKG